jgi:hypothetical protein
VQTRDRLPTSIRLLHLAEEETGPFFEHVGFKRHERGWWVETQNYTVRITGAACD